MSLTKKTLIAMLACSLCLTGCHSSTSNATDESYSSVAAQVPDQQPSAEGAAEEAGLLSRLMRSCALQSAKEEFESPAVIYNRQTTTDRWMIVFKAEDALYEIELMTDLSGGIITCYALQFKNGRLTGMNMNLEEGTLYNVGAVFEKEAEFKDDFDAQIQDDVLNALSLDSFSLIREFPDFFEVWKHARSDVHCQYGWRVTDREALSEAISKSRYATLGNTLPPDFFGTFTVVESGAVIEWSNTEFEGRQNVGAIRMLESMNTQFWIDFFNNPLPAEESTVDLAGAWPQNLPAF